jgi:hypothetical protein
VRAQGSNLGVQIRKVYSPQQFPGAPVLEVFDRVFGSNRSRVCALGAEPNPAHRPYLNTLNAHFRRKGFQALVLTDTAVSTHAGEATLHLDAGSPAQWGASLTAGPWHRHTNASARTATVQLLDLPRVLADVVLPFVRRTQLARGGARPPVVMKLDVEGAEYALLPALMLNGALCSMQAVYYESHPQAMRSADAVNMTFPAMLAAFAQLRTSSPRCGVKLLALDDESFLHGDRVPLVRLR